MLDTLIAYAPFALFAIVGLILFVTTRASKNKLLYDAIACGLSGVCLLSLVLKSWLESLVVATALWLLAGSLEYAKEWFKARRKRPRQDAGPDSIK